MRYARVLACLRETVDFDPSSNAGMKRVGPSDV